MEVLAGALFSSAVSDRADQSVDLAQIALMCLIGLLLLTLGFLIAYAVLGKKKAPPPRVKRIPVPPASAATVPTRGIAGASTAAGGGGGAAGAIVLQTRTQGPMACPSCRREFEAGVKFCPQDARRLVPAAEIVERSRASGSVCPRCKRAYDAGVRFCAHDAEELVPAALWETTHGKKAHVSPTGIIAKLCPQCQQRYDLAMSFCTRDGTELVTVN